MKIATAVPSPHLNERLSSAEKGRPHFASAGLGVGTRDCT